MIHILTYSKLDLEHELLTQAYELLVNLNTHYQY